MPVLDIFNQDSFSAASLTGAVNLVPNDYGRIRELGLFTAEPVPTRSVIVAIENGVLNLLPTRPLGAPPTYGTRGRQAPKSFVIPHIPHDDYVLASDVQNMIALFPNNGALQLESVENFTNRKLMTMRRKHAITLEHLRVTALRGVILDADGTTLLDIFAAFGVTPKVVDFVLGTTTTDVLAKCIEVAAYMEDNLQGETMTGIHALASPEFFAKLVSHAKVTEAFKYFQQTQNPLTQDLRRRFVFGPIVFEEYRGTADYIQEDGTKAARRFIPAGDVRFFPLGTQDTFTNFWAPPDFMGSVNTAPNVADSEVFVAPLEPMEFGKGVKMHTESNPLPLVKRPALLVRGHSSN